MTTDLPGPWLPFDALSPRDLHDALKLRADVFVVEQASVFREIDGKDPRALHLLVRAPDGELAGYARILPPDDGEAAKIGRVVTHPSHRGTGLGRRMMLSAVAEAERRFKGLPIELQAQSHLERFYASFGFVRVSDDYDEDGILHCDMRRSP
jgi:ElaA protein